MSSWQKNYLQENKKQTLINKAFTGIDLFCFIYIWGFQSSEHLYRDLLSYDSTQLKMVTNISEDLLHPCKATGKDSPEDDKI
jgi:hypothetical protein